MDQQVVIWSVIGIAALFATAVIVNAIQRARFAATARSLGLEAHGFSMRGRLRGVAVNARVERRKVGYRYDDDGDRKIKRKSFTVVDVALPDALPRRFRMQSVGWLDRLGARLGAEREWDLDDAKVEAAFDFELDDPLQRETMRAALAHEKVRAAMRAVADTGFELTVQPGRARLERKGREVGAASLGEAVEALTAFAQRLSIAHSWAVDNGPERICSTEWAEAASDLGLERDGYAVRGRLRGVHVEARTSLDDDERVTRVRASLAPPLDLAPDELSKLWRALRRPRTAPGEERFRPEIRAHLEALGEAGRVDLHPESLTLHVPGLVREQATLRATLERLAEVARALAGAEPGPFR